jgi:C4-dicarboxylate transporter DctQ subunit
VNAEPKSGAGRIVDQIEETLIALLLGLMTLVTFANVIARYVFNDNILWALETTVFLFAWLVLLGASYCVKITAHLGVDAVIGLASPPVRRVLVLTSVVCCLAFSILLLIGAWQYWSPFFGRQVWYEVNDIPMPAFLQFLSDWLNEGERYEKMPRFIPYFALPLGMALLTFRFLQAGWRVLKGEQETLIAAHEAEIDSAGVAPVDRVNDLPEPGERR